MANEIQRLKKAYIKKLQRLRRAGVPESLLPTLPSTTNKNAVDQLRAFLNRGNDRYRYIQDSNGEWISRRDFAALQRRTELAKRNANALITEFNARYGDQPFKVQGETTDYRTVAKDSFVDPARLFTKDVRSISSISELNKYYSRVSRVTPAYFEKADAQWRDNTAKAILEVHGSAGQELVDFIYDDLPLDEFVKAMYTNDISTGYVYTDADRDDALSNLWDIFLEARDNYERRVGV